MMQRMLTTALLVMAAGALGSAQTPRPASPRGSSATQLGGQWVKNDRGVERYQGGKWIEITYGRPLKRGRADLFGSGAEYGKKLNGGAPIWRAGADVTTRLKTDLPLQFGEKTVPPGEYSVFIDLKENNWTLVLSSWPAQEKYDPANKAALWGGYDYTPDKDVARAPMKVEKIPISVDQLSWGFVDVTNAGGKLVVWWDTVMATAPFTVGQ